MGKTTTAELGDTIPTIIEEAQFTREHDTVMRGLTWNIKKGKGSTVNVPYFGTVVSSQLTEGIDMISSETMEDTNVQITPYEAGLKIMLTDNVIEDDNEDLIRAAGVLLGKAYERKVDEDLLARLDNGTTSLGGSGTTLTMGHLAAARQLLRGNARSSGGPAPAPFATIIHPYTEIDILDILTPIVPNTGTTGVQSYTGALAEQAILNASVGRLFGMQVFSAGNLSIDASNDAKGGVFAVGQRGAIIYVSAREPGIEEERDASARAWELNYVGRYGVGNYLNGWTVELYNDAVAPA